MLRARASIRRRLGRRSRGCPARAASCSPRQRPGRREAPFAVRFEGVVAGYTAWPFYPKRENLPGSRHALSSGRPSSTTRSAASHWRARRDADHGPVRCERDRRSLVAPGTRLAQRRSLAGRPLHGGHRPRRLPGHLLDGSHGRRRLEDRRRRSPAGAISRTDTSAARSAPSTWRIPIPNVIYVGTGSADIRGNTSTGRGAWKTTDGGDSWSFLGLREAGQIGSIEVDPRDAGHRSTRRRSAIPSGPTRSAASTAAATVGASWQRVLYVSEHTGAMDIQINQRNPREIWASMWTAERKPWTMISGSEEAASGARPTAATAGTS